MDSTSKRPNGYDKDYIEGLIEQGTKSWKDVPDKDKWLDEMRGRE
ncbi:hypothetical protein [Dyadobacter sandarakinus]|nr:hypothetical protein [Dyadobacter sandarakinus]